MTKGGKSNGMKKSKEDSKKSVSAHAPRDTWGKSVTMAEGKHNHISAL